jgi:hypothetical protein
MGSTVPILYRSWSGFPVVKMSYSLASDVDFCGAKTIFARFRGFAPKIDSAALKFGIAVEDTIVESYIKNTILESNFKAKWEQFRDVPLKYSKNDSDWSTLNRSGIALMKEFVDVRDMFPIVKPEFGVVFPRDPNQTWFRGTRLEYIADLVSHYPDGDILIDVKTAGRSYPEKSEAEGYAALDPQLLVGALASGIRRVGFLVFVKTRIPKIQFHLGTVNDESLEQIDLWLQDQYYKLINRRLVRRPGFRYPDDKCLNCDFLLKCLGRHEEAAKILRVKESRETENFMSTLDDLI